MGNCGSQVFTATRSEISLPAAGPFHVSTTLYLATIPPATSHSTTAMRSAPSTISGQVRGSIVVARELVAPASKRQTQSAEKRRYIGFSGGEDQPRLRE